MDAKIKVAVTLFSVWHVLITLKHIDGLACCRSDLITFLFARNECTSKAMHPKYRIYSVYVTNQKQQQTCDGVRKCA